MARKTKNVLLGVIIIILVIVGGIFLQKHEEKKRDQAIVDEYKPIVEDFMKDNFAGVNSVEFKGWKKNPMDTIYLSGYVNGKESYLFDAPLHKDKDGNYDSGGMVVSKELNSLNIN
ncbi:DUF1433 domain-containing protein [Listeria booriae]|uniref:DUF1433 domain-containing protein n=1 Tax=Listeria booriae TaxID=1552123 RepID=A0A842FRN4_9LIST|nr:DUF1433 domain-containing protein [Listeria booriae]MBC2285759.1 DUF1433 domain-containing protein [Listeria booriae]